VAVTPKNGTSERRKGETRTRKLKNLKRLFDSFERRFEKRAEIALCGGRGTRSDGPENNRNTKELKREEPDPHGRHP